MRTIILTAAAAAVAAATPAFAQDQSVDNGTATAPDGSKAFGIEPYVGIMGGYENFDNEPTDSHIPQPANGGNYDGGLVEGVAGVNVPLGPVFVGVEGNAAKGFTGDIDWEYGAAGRFGVRAGDSGMIYGKVGYQWVNFAALGDDSRDYGEMVYGAGVEIGPKDIGLKGITGNAGPRLRFEVSTYGDMHSIRPMAGVVTHF